MINSNLNLKEKGEMTIDNGHYYFGVVDKTFWIVSRPTRIYAPGCSNESLASWSFKDKKKLTSIPFNKYIADQIKASNRTYGSLVDVFWSLYALDYDKKGDIVWDKYTDQVDLRHVSLKFNRSKSSAILNVLHSAFCHDGMVKFYRQNAQLRNPLLSKAEINEIEDNILNDKIQPYMFIDFEQKKAWHFLTTSFGLVSKSLWQRFLAGEAKLIVQEASFDLLESSMASISSEEFEKDLENGIDFNLWKY